MLNDLTPEQWAKIKRGWVPVAGHLYVNPADHHDWWRVLAVNADGQVLEWVDCLHGCYTPEDGEWPEDAVPCFWGDHATADGLLRTARAITGIPSLVAVMVGPGRDGRARWALQRMVWDHGAEYQLLTATRWGGLGIPMMWESEPAALLAAILAAPDAA